jgi:glycosyltransferase involved in cell wall biosynthesis
MSQAYSEKSFKKVIPQSILFPGISLFQHCLQVSVIVPVRNEAAHLLKTLEALRNQLDEHGNPLSAGIYEVLLLANNCTDNSAQIAINYQQKFPAFLLQVKSIYLPPAKANIGTVRRMLMDEAFRRLTENGNPNGIIASTDGDTIVDSQWIGNIIKEIAKGNDAVGGRILTKADNSRSRLYHLRDVMYRTLLAQAETILDPVINDPWPRHFQYFGASLAVTCKAYERAGRLPQVPYLEDKAFYNALIGIDAKVRKSNAVKVYTSTRMAGRVEVGFSEQLKKWNGLARKHAAQLVEPAEALLIKFKNRFALRKCRQIYLKTGRCPKEVISIARALSISAVWLKIQLENSRYFGCLWQQVEKKMVDGKWNAIWKPVPITIAIAELRLFISGSNFPDTLGLD